MLHFPWNILLIVSAAGTAFFSLFTYCAGQLKTQDEQEFEDYEQTEYTEEYYRKHCEKK